ncbi:putative peroxiredoxin bcp [Pseudovibrio axinellae]|uniref:thioredoxin-dependent peroxiredoxin n=1 Tax=Pseudovibrio axinellae TaxID=989403 RepID=A0A166B2N3_9HYPH|nr:thioredoxin-dependent thiol peroxidase [Pseudovibrio axinellae]KZL21834.1 putative peroxiredoxin bcp [Pseudovibrio axinellae]SEQ80212.1 peroxiredoxin Q/BCP [Pseudovibrio axinellae]
MPDTKDATPSLPQEGMHAPDFTIATDSQGQFTLSEHIGQPVVLYFYPKDDTPGCTKEAIAFTDQSAELKKHHTEIIGISPDTTLKHDKFKAKHGLTVTLGADTEKEVCHTYGVWVEKNMYGKKYMGVERSTFLIDKEGKIVKIWRKVRVPGHVEKVLEELENLSK